jgi:hypothetical protein
MRIALPHARATRKFPLRTSWLFLAAAALALGLAVVGTRAQARTAAAVRLDPPAVPPQSLTQPRPETPPQLDPDVTPRDCDACKLADATSGKIPLEAIHLASRVLPDGIAVRATADDPQSRELLWKAVIARGELIESLRSGSGTHLCATCKRQNELLRDLHIETRRIPEGVELQYTSASPDVVRRIHAALQATQQLPARF